MAVTAVCWRHNGQGFTCFKHGLIAVAELLNGTSRYGAHIASGLIGSSAFTSEHSGDHNSSPSRFYRNVFIDLSNGTTDCGRQTFQRLRDRQ